MKRLITLISAAAIAGCTQSVNPVGEITINDQIFKAADVIAWQRTSPLDNQVQVTTVTIAANKMNRKLAEKSLQTLGFFAPDTLHVQLTILDDGCCHAYDVGITGDTDRFWTGKSIDLDCHIQVDDSQVSGSVTTLPLDLTTPLPHGFDLSFEAQYLQWN